MKAEELMVGDWVLYGGAKCKVVGFFYGKLEVKLPRIGETLNDAPLKEISPIPLTPEILEKNGFKKSEYGWYNRKIDEWEIEIYIGRIETIVKINKGVYPHINNTDCHFLHQLQHALRLCGIEKEITL